MEIALYHILGDLPQPQLAHTDFAEEPEFQRPFREREE